MTKFHSKVRHHYLKDVLLLDFYTNSIGCKRPCSRPRRIEAEPRLNIPKFSLLTPEIFPMQVMVASYEVSIQESALLYVAETYKTLYPEGILIFSCQNPVSPAVMFF